MLINKKGNILESTENVICHQVNEDGVMGGGLALQIAMKYPKVEEAYSSFTNIKIDNNEELYGTFFLVKIDENKYIANCYTQENFKTNLYYIKECFSYLLKECQNHNWTITIPYGYGCGIADGNWEEVEQVFKELSDKAKIDISIYQLDKENK